MKKLLYIGEDQAAWAQLETQEGWDAERVNNIVSFYNQLERLDEFDMVVASQNLKGTRGAELFLRYRNLLHQRHIPFALVHPNFDLAQRKKLLEEGIMEIFPDESYVANLEDRHAFLKDMLQIRLSNKKRIKAPEYKIPLAKRIFDIVVASFALLMLSPVYLGTIIAIRLESKGPIFYISKRVGTGYNVFNFYKFRSMYVDADARLKDLQHLNQYAKSESSESSAAATEQSSVDTPDIKVPEELTLIHKDGTPISEEEYRELKRKQAAGTFVKIANDPRVTKVGKFIRNTSIDELPQIFNVLKGDMSIVGNRPLPLYEAEQLTSDDWGERFLAPAGITGLWQVEKRGKGEMSEEERKGLDNRYAKDFSFWNDIRLILKTIPALLQKENV